MRSKLTLMIHHRRDNKDPSAQTALISETADLSQA